MQAFLPFVLVGLGSMAGGVSRYGISLWTQNISVFSIPYGTLISNLAGCLIIGVIAGISGKSELLSSEMRLLLATGFCGGFTTMSSFVYELGQFVQDKEYCICVGADAQRLYFEVNHGDFRTGLIVTDFCRRK